MMTYINHKEHEAASDHSALVLIRGRYYRVIAPPLFVILRDTAIIEAVLLPNRLYKSDQ